MSYTLDTNIPTGSWTLYFHSADDNKWDIHSFIKIQSLVSWCDWWSIVESLKDKSFAEGMFFIMKDPIPPLWENAKNVKGGSYSFRIQKAHASDVFISTSIACMLGQIVVNPENIIHGISISPKKGFNIIKIWNIDSVRFKNPSDIYANFDNVKKEEIMYTPFLEKKM